MNKEWRKEQRNKGTKKEEGWLFKGELDDERTKRSWKEKNVVGKWKKYIDERRIGGGEPSVREIELEKLFGGLLL